jgi:transcriptional antiterminator RfaH
MTSNSGDPGVGHAWFCLKAQPKHEHIAASHLRQYDDVEVFNPRIRYTRATRTGPALVTESMFPGYLFARFEWHKSLSKVHYGRGVRGVVHFGTRWPTIPDAAIEQVQQALGSEDLHEIPSDLHPGDEVTVSGTVFHGLEAVINQVMPTGKRITILLNFLGQQTTVEMSSTTVVKQNNYR